MAIKVINRKPHKSVVKRLICEECGVTLEYTPKDMVLKNYSCCGSLESDYFIKCPECNYETVVLD